MSAITRSSWGSMRARCNGRPEKNPHYAGRGISVCERWNESFDAFLKDMGERPSLKYTIDRIDCDGNYEPGNCRWATRAEQVRNRRVCVNITIDGVTKTRSEWANQFGRNDSTVAYRILHGESPESALSREPYSWESIKRRNRSIVSLTQAQARLVLMIDAETETNGTPPTVSELSGIIGIGTNAVQERLNSLRKRGLVSWARSKSRTIRTMKLSRVPAQLIAESRCRTCGKAVFGKDALAAHSQKDHPLATGDDCRVRKSSSTGTEG